MTETGLLENILNRLSSSGVAAALFGADEVADWPPGTLDLFVNSGLLRRAQPSHVIECRGCEEYCDMSVNIYPADGNRPAQAFIVCDKSQNIGRVRVEFSRLAQWQMTGELLAAVLVQLLEFNEPAKANGKHWNIGVIKGNTNNKSLVVLLVKDCFTLSLAGHTIALAEVLTIKKNALALDKAKLIRLVNNSVGNTETPEARRDRLAARIKEEKVKQTKAFNQVVAEEEGISVSRLKQILKPAKYAPASPFAALMSSTKPSQKKTKPKR